MPLVSVITSVLNGERYLDDAVSSIVAQTFDDFEYIVIDDGSTDKTAEILNRWQEREPRLRFISRENRGFPNSLNEAASLASGKYLAVMDGDDIACSERLATQVAVMEADPEVVALGAQVEIIDAEGRPLKQSFQPCDHETIYERHRRTVLPQLYHPSTLLRASAFYAIGGYREAFAKVEDYDLWLRLEEHGKLANCPEVLLQYRVHMNSVSHRNSAIQSKLAWQSAKEAAERRQQDFTHPYPAPVNNHAEHPIDLYRKWGWWALSAGNLASARHYATKVLLKAPFKRESWILCACTLRGR